MIINIEGPDGSGKSTLVPELAKAIQQRPGHHAVRTYQEPNRGYYGTKLRQLEPSARSPIVELGLAIAARAIFKEPGYRHRARCPESPDTHLISDRCYVSSAVYQSRGRDEEFAQMIVDMHREVVLHEDLLIVMDAPSEVLARRRRERAEATHYLEESRIQMEVEKRYRRLVATDGEDGIRTLAKEVIHLDATFRTEDQIAAIFDFLSFRRRVERYFHAHPELRSGVSVTEAVFAHALTLADAPFAMPSADLAERLRIVHDTSEALIIQYDREGRHTNKQQP